MVEYSLGFYFITTSIFADFILMSIIFTNSTVINILLLMEFNNR